MQDTITKPLLKWYGENKRVLPWREKRTRMKSGFRDYAPADEGGGGQAVL